MGIYPQPFLQRMKPAVELSLQRILSTPAKPVSDNPKPSGESTTMDVNLIPLLPAAQVLVTALVVMMRDLFIKEHEPKGILALLSLIGLGLASAKAMLLWGSQRKRIQRQHHARQLRAFFHPAFCRGRRFDDSLLDSIRPAGRISTRANSTRWFCSPPSA